MRCIESILSGLFLDIRRLNSLAVRPLGVTRKEELDGGLTLIAPFNFKIKSSLHSAQPYLLLFTNRECSESIICKCPRWNSGNFINYGNRRK